MCRLRLLIYAMRMPIVFINNVSLFDDCHTWAMLGPAHEEKSFTTAHACLPLFLSLSLPSPLSQLLINNNDSQCCF